MNSHQRDRSTIPGISMANVLMLILFTTMLAGGQLLFKQVGLVMQGRPAAEGFLLAARAPALYAALALYGVSTLLWIWILSRVSLSQAYPWIGVGTAIVPLLAVWVFGERVGAAYWMGVAFVMLGVWLTQYAAQGR
jgi:drug/metabolite transporter (DMT)-like permease